MASGGYFNLGARGKNFQKFMLSEKKKRSDLGLDIFLPKSKCSLKKKKGLHFNFTSNFPIFLPKSRCSLKKKKKVFTFNFISDFPLYLPKSRCSPKKKGLHSKSSTERIQNCICCFRGGALKIEGGPQKKGGPEVTASFASPNIHHCIWPPFQKSLVRH